MCILTNSCYNNVFVNIIIITTANQNMKSKFADSFHYN